MLLLLCTLSGTTTYGFSATNQALILLQFCLGKLNDTFRAPLPMVIPRCVRGLVIALQQSTCFPHKNPGFQPWQCQIRISWKRADITIS